MDTASAPPAAAQTGAPVKKKSGRTLGFFLYRQGAGVPFGIALGLFLLFVNPKAATVTEMAMWGLIPPIIIYGLYLGVTQILPVTTAQMFESHFEPIKDIAVSVWPPGAALFVMGLSAFVDDSVILGVATNVDITWIEWGIILHVMIAFSIDFGAFVFAMIKNRLAQETGLGSMKQ